MSIKNLLLIIILFFLVFLSLYTWNIRTGTLDKVSTSTGLEVTGGVLKSADRAVSGVRSLWFNYIDLMNVRDENAQLKKRIVELEQKLDNNTHHVAENRRLNKIFAMKAPEEWSKVASRVLATKLGSFSVLESIVLDKGYLEGVAVGRPVMTDKHLLGRVYQASPTASIALLIEDLGSKVAVISGDTRLQGVLSGAGASKDLELHFINQDAKVYIGEILYTSGLDGSFPKGIPVAQVVAAQSEMSEVFQIYYAEPLANFSSLEEVVVLNPPVNWNHNISSPVLAPMEEEELRNTHATSTNILSEKRP